METRLERVWIADCKMDGSEEIRLDWSNGRHHAARIAPPGGPMQVLNALQYLEAIVRNDIVHGQLNLK